MAKIVRTRIVPTLFDLWIRTERACRASLPRTGKLAAKWAKEERKRAKKLAASGPPDASFSIVHYNPDTHVPNRDAAIHNDKRKTLLSKLVFYRPQK
jgi:spore germination cell wall hydrolase CwlJ-like protein